MKGTWLLAFFVFISPVTWAQQETEEKSGGFFKEVKNLVTTRKPGRLTGEPWTGRKHAKQAGKFLKQDIYRAACGYLDALDRKPRKKKYRQKLAAILENAYQSKLTQARQDFDAVENLSALAHFEHLSLYVISARDHGLLSFAPEDNGGVIAQTKQRIAEEYYNEARNLFAGEQFQEAIKKYRELLTYVAPFKDSAEQIAFSFFAIGKRALSAKQFEAAAGAFYQATREKIGYEEATKYGCEIYYQLGNYYSLQANHRKAVACYKAIAPMSGFYRDTPERFAHAKKKATQSIGIITDLNANGHTVFGQDANHYISQKIRDVLTSKKSRFILINPQDQDRDFNVRVSVDRILSEESNKDSEVVEKVEQKYKKIKGNIPGGGAVATAPTIKRRQKSPDKNKENGETSGK